MTLVVGIDGCSGRWLCIARRLGRLEFVAEVRDIQGICDFAALADVVAIDIPIGLPDRDDRACDKAARAVLRPGRASSVFPVPVWAALMATNYDDAKRISIQASGRSLTQQTWAILPKIAEVDLLLRECPAIRERIHEVHPEVSFWAWNNRRPMPHPKRDRQGHADRRALVTAHYGDVYDQIYSRVCVNGAAPDDVLDALAALWTAERIASGSAETLPNFVECDSFGRKMAITY